MIPRSGTERNPTRNPKSEIRSVWTARHGFRFGHGNLRRAHAVKPLGIIRRVGVNELELAGGDLASRTEQRPIAGRQGNVRGAATLNFAALRLEKVNWNAPLLRTVRPVR